VRLALLILPWCLACTVSVSDFPGDGGSAGADARLLDAAAAAADSSLPGADAGPSPGADIGTRVDSGSPDIGMADVGAADIGTADVGKAPGADAAGPADSSALEVTFTPSAIPDDFPNPMRGQYRWLGVAPNPSTWTDNDSYQRWNWDSLEPTHLAYQWNIIDDQLTAAHSRHGRFGMRLMALCQGCGSHLYQGAHSSIPDDLAAVVNPLIGAAPGETEKYVIPDWNSTAYLDRLEELLNAISARYGDDPSFGFVDVMSYGNWGEFHLYPFTQAGGPYDTSTQRPITDDNARKIVQLNATAFAKKLLVINSEQKAALAAAVASTSPLIGVRVDCLGSDGLAGGDNAMSGVPASYDRWRTAPFITEWCQYNLGSSGADLFVQGESQVRQYHISMLSSGNFQNDPSGSAEVTAFNTANQESGYRLRVSTLTVRFDPASRQALQVSARWVNDNVAPTYLAWRVVFGLKGPAQVEPTLSVDLRQVMPDAPTDHADTLQLAAPLAAGSYQAYLRVEDVQGVSLPMNLAMGGRDADGNYPLGTIQIP
jgi:hypothetical protein